MLIKNLLIAHKINGYDSGYRSMKWYYTQIKDYLICENIIDNIEQAEKIQDLIYSNINTVYKNINIPQDYPLYLCNNYDDDKYFIEVWLNTDYLDNQKDPIYRKGSIKIRYLNKYIRFQYIKWSEII